MKRRRFLSALSLIAFLWLPLAALANDSCRAIFDLPLYGEVLSIDSRYGRANQWDPALADKGLIGPGHSMLCGPTCVYNVLEKLRIVDGRKMSPGSDADEVADLVHHLYPEIGMPASDIVNYGINIPKLAEGLQIKINQEKLLSEVQVYSAKYLGDQIRPGIKLSQLKNSATSDHTVIVGLGFYKTSDPMTVSEANLVMRHFMIVTGFDPSNPMRFFLSNPMNPTRTLSAVLTPVQPPGFSSLTYQLVFDDTRSSGGTILLWSVISTRRVK